MGATAAHPLPVLDEMYRSDPRDSASTTSGRQLVAAAIAIAVLGLLLWTVFGLFGSDDVLPAPMPVDPEVFADFGGPVTPAVPRDADGLRRSTVDGDPDVREPVRVHRASTDSRVVARTVDAETGTPVPGLRVHVYSRSLLRDVWKAETLFARRPIAIAESDAQGQVHLPRRMTGRLHLDVAGPEHHSVAYAEVDLTSARVVEPTEIPVAYGGRIQGVVRGPDLEPWGAGTVMAIPGPEAMLAAAQGAHLTVRWQPIEADGSFELFGVPAGTGWRIAALHGRFPPTRSTPFSVRPGGVALVDVVTAIPRVLRGIVVDAAGARVPGARVQYSMPDAGGWGGLDLLKTFMAPRREAVTDDRGRFVFGGVPVGRIELWASATGRPSSDRYGLDLGDDPAPTAQIVLHGEAALHGVVVDSGGAAVADAAVVFLGKDGRKKVLPVERRLSVRTDQDGRFLLDPPGRPRSGPVLLLVSATLPPAGQGGMTGQVERVDLPTAGPIRFVLREGRRLAGRVVRAEDGEPIRAFVVSVDAPEELRRFGRDARNAHQLPVSSDDGAFLTPLLFHDVVEVRVSAEGFESATRVVPLPAAEPELFELVPASSLTGTVVDGGRVGIEGAAVEVGEWRPDGLVRMVERRTGPAAITDASGRFEIIGVRRSDDRYIHVRKGGFAPLQNHRIVWDQGRGPRPVELVLQRGGTVFGTVTDELGHRTPGVVVAAFAIGDGGALRTTTADGRGEYALESLDTRVSYSLAVLGADQELGVRDLLAAAQVSQVQIAEGERMRVDLRAPGRGDTSLSGRVTFADGEPLRAGKVLVVPRADGLADPTGLGGARHAQTDRDGRFEIENLKAGEYEIAFGELATGDPGAAVAGRRTVTLSAGTPGHVDLVIPGGVVHGTVVAASTGEPLVGATVFLESTGSSPSAAETNPFLFRSLVSRKTGSDGGFRFGSVAAGKYRVRVRPATATDGTAGFAEVLSDPIVVTEAAGVIPVHLRSPAASQVDLRVVDGERRSPLAGAVVYVDRGDQAGLRPRGRTDQEGQLRLTGLPAGAQTLVVRAVGFREHREPLVGEAGVSQQRTIAMQRGALLRVTVLDQGLAVAGASVIVERGDGVLLPSRRSFFGDGWTGRLMTTDARGLFETTLLDPGRYTLRARRAGRASPPVEVTVPARGQVEATLHLGR